MKKFDAVNISITSLYILSAFMLSGIVSSFFVMILGKIVYLEFFLQAIISSVLSMCVSAAILYCLVHRASYRAADFSSLAATVEMLISLAVNCVIGLVFGFLPITSGGVRNLAGIFQFGNGFDSAEMLGEISLFMKLIAFFAYAVVFSLVANLAGRKGADKRERDRKSLLDKKIQTEQEESFGGFKL